MTQLPVLETTASKASAECEIVAVFQNKDKKVDLTQSTKNSKYKENLQKFSKADVFSGRPSSVLFVRFGGVKPAEHVLFAGLGSVSELTEEGLRCAGGNLHAKLKAEKVESIAFDFDAFVEVIKGSGLNVRKAARAFAEGLVLCHYAFDKYKAKKENFKLKVIFKVSDKKLKPEIQHELDYVRAALECMNLTRDWSNEPSNVGTPEYFANEAKRFAKAHGLKCTILTEADAKKEKMGLFLAVGQGAEREGRIVVLEYTPKKTDKNTKTVALVGKGITFDSGGISIKPSLRMEEMKHDMTGAATLMGATLLAAHMKVPNRIVTILAFTENMPDGNAVQPGNIIVSRAGKTVEIINTDAEGRLILADVLDYAHEFKPDVILDAATLTGAVQIALGKHCCAILGNHYGLMNDIMGIGKENGERIWNLPLFEEYFDDLKSDYADMKNSANDGNGGTIRGAIFLERFIRKGTKWAHLDIAAMANNVNYLPYIPKRGASGIYVRTVANFIAQF